ncbi:MAG TPA: nuclear transport factor 2 family protein [Acetobacteraceae bacterium]|nr:nuclear transport factor 2 family protein [Acetobacteraceae bacterium]
MASEEAEKNAIRELLATYCFHLDNYRFADMAALFTEDGTWDTAFGKGTGRAGIVAQAESIGTAGARPRRVHLTTNIVIALNGDTATVQSNWTVIQNSANGPKIGSGGAYQDQVVKQDGKWLFRYRKIDRFLAEGLM